MHEIYDKEVLIFAPSLGRADTCTTHEALPSVKYVVAEREAEEYAKRVSASNMVVVSDGIQQPPSGKCRTLNWLLDNYKKDDNIIIFTDDDIKSIAKVDFDNNEETSVSEEEVIICVQKLAFIAKQIGAKIGGFSALSSADSMLMGLTNRYKLTQKKYIDGKAFIVYEDDGTRFDETMYLKEDIEFNCQSLVKNKRTLSAGFVCFVGKALTNKGGVVSVRTNEEELRQGAIMFERYSGMLKTRVSNVGNGVRKNAVQLGLR